MIVYLNGWTKIDVMEMPYADGVTLQLMLNEYYAHRAQRKKRGG